MLETLLLATTLLGCGGAPMDRQLPIYRGRGGVLQQPVDTLGLETTIAGPADRVWSAIASVYADLGLEVNFREPSSFRIGACYQKVRSRLGKELLSVLLDCGETNSIPNADRYDIGLTVLSTVQSNHPMTSVFTFVLGVGLNASGAASNRIWCYSKGVLEERIRAELQRRVVG
jgi:hypothetical protein